jgi:putative addiction module component (TIGR02574 family)
MANPKLDELLKLPTSERVELAMALWESVENSAEAQAAFPISDELKAELDRRAADHEKDPSSGVPWEEVKRRLHGRP